jgi:hypothetical protein
VRRSERQPWSRENLPPTAASAVALVFGAVIGSAATIGAALGWTEPYRRYTVSLVLLLAAAGQAGGKRRNGASRSFGVGLLVVVLFVVHALGSWLATPSRVHGLTGDGRALATVGGHGHASTPLREMRSDVRQDALRRHRTETYEVACVCEVPYRERVERGANEHVRRRRAVA